ncbi:MAG: 3-hydroxyacyl-CoA dehydrogenase [Desulfatibacillaceae bacterium]
MQAEDIKKVLIVGAGTMGHQIGFLCAMNGLDVALYDVSPEVREAVPGRIERLGAKFVRHGKLSAEGAESARARMTMHADPAEAAAEADIVSESVPEDPELKGRIFAEFDRLCPERTIFTTNTSSLVPSMFAEATGRPDRLLALHFHHVLMTNVVDIMPHPGTSGETLSVVEGFCRRIGQNAIVLKKEHPGYVFNTMLSEWFRSAQTLAASGVATPQDVDRAWMGVMHAPMGPFGLMDTVGLDTVWKITDYWANKLEDPRARMNADFMKKYVDEGRLGTKVGKGFYDYPNPAFQQPGFIESGGRDSG